MSTPQERQFAQHEAMLSDSDPLYVSIVVLAHRRLLAYFDKHEPALGAAIRYGLSETEVWHGSEPSTKTVGIGPVDYQLYRINEPESS